jgi:CRP-like cAMP-binding protein
VKKIQHAFKKGEIIFAEGSCSDSVYIIEEGEVEIAHLKNDGSLHILGILKSNDIFGEMGLIDDMPRSATAKALTDCRISIINKSKFDTLIQQQPELLKPILMILSQRLRETLTLLKEGYKQSGTDRRKPMV